MRLHWQWGLWEQQRHEFFSSVPLVSSRLRGQVQSTGDKETHTHTHAQANHNLAHLCLSAYSELTEGPSGLLYMQTQPAFNHLIITQHISLWLTEEEPNITKSTHTISLCLSLSITHTQKKKIWGNFQSLLLLFSLPLPVENTGRNQGEEQSC